MMHRRICIILLIIIFIFPARQHPRTLQATSITITASRSTQLANLCTNTDRASLYNQYGLSKSIPYMTDFSRFFSLDSTIFDLFLNLDVIEINNQLRSNTLGYATYIAPAFIGPAILLFLSPMLLMCLCCPCQCCLRKKLQYTGCEQTWPVLVTMLLAIAVIATCFVGLLTKYKLHSGYQQLSCSGIIGVDDALYGAASYDNNSFFAGISTIHTQLQSLNSGNLNFILGNLTAVSSSSTTVSSALNLMNSALYNISIIPDPSAGSLSLNYNAPLASSTPTSTISSIFPTILGTSSSNSTLVGTAYTAVSAASNNLSSITTIVDSFKSQSSAFAMSVNQMINDTANSISLLRTTLLTVKDIFVTEDYFSTVYYVEILFYGIILGLTVLYLLSLTVFSCCDKMSCRHILYLFGFLLFIVALATFAAFFFLSYSSAILYSGCNYMSSSISDPNTFITNVQKLGIDSTVATQYSVCLPGQSGNIIGKLSGDQNRNYLSMLQYVMTNITSFNGSALSSQITASYAPLTQILNNYASASTSDIMDTASIQALKRISNANNFNCTSANFQFDSWIPSIHQTDNSIPCNSPSGMPNSDNTTCTSTTNFNAPTLSCQGCMGTFSLLYNATSQASAYSMLNNRYTDCMTFNNELANIWQNYYLIKKNVLGQVKAREYIAQQSVQAVTQSLTQNVVPTFKTTINNLYQTAQSVLTPNYGVLWGLDCEVIGEDMILFQESACTNTFSYSYFHRILCLVISFGLLLLLCCNTCTIFRRRKDILEAIQGPRIDRAVPYVHPDPLSNARLQNNYL